MFTSFAVVTGRSRTTPHGMSFVGSQEATASSLQLLGTNVYVNDIFAAMGPMCRYITEGVKVDDFFGLY
ncbi:hypothetical protein AVEN_177974-1 [Araneus ventricosus]|uniref:Uncharacterized protein n=1 Tax=Araneus ventricosus TaxID=182803 RepID=A0A4Y2EKT3_ARAVE|nr:hypothetical protein AVEN_177974-1 [Araneus ventricosus]